MSQIRTIVYDPVTPDLAYHHFGSMKRLVFGKGTANKVGVETKNLGNVKRVLVLTDEGVKKANLLERVMNPLNTEGLKVDLYDKVEPEPSIESFRNVAEVVRNTKYDALVALGGGSSMDTTKAAAVFAANCGDVEQFLGVNKAKNGPIRNIRIPTTAGTGSEATYYAMVTRGVAKDFIGDMRLSSDVTIVDPYMSMSMPPKLTAATGMDALSHVIGQLMSVWGSPLLDGLIFEAVRLIFRSLRKATFNGDDVQARYDMAMAATMGGIVNGGVTIEHALAHTIGARYHLPHGVTCAVALPYAMMFGLPLVQNKFALLLHPMGEFKQGLTEYEAAVAAVRAVAKLSSDIGTPQNLKELNIPQNDMPTLVDDMFTGKSGQIPEMWLSVRKPDRENILETFERMWEGKIL